MKQKNYLPLKWQDWFTGVCGILVKEDKQHRPVSRHCIEVNAITLRDFVGECQHPEVEECDECDGEGSHCCDCEYCDSHTCNACLGSGQNKTPAPRRPFSYHGIRFDRNAVAYVLEHAPPSPQLTIALIGQKRLCISTRAWIAVIDPLLRDTATSAEPFESWCTVQPRRKRPVALRG